MMKGTGSNLLPALTPVASAVASSGAGTLSVPPGYPDHDAQRIADRQNQTARAGYAERQSPAALLPRIVIVGAGFGGLTCARALRHARAALTIIDQRNFNLFQPLLYQVATAALSPADISMPIRRILQRQRNARVILGHVEAIDPLTRRIFLSGSDQKVAYDYLVIATGARHAYFGHEEWEPFAPGLKDIEDATEIRRRVLEAFERAEVEAGADERRRLLSFIIIGAGPTGVEMAGAIAELAKSELAMPYRSIHGQRARIVLIEAGQQILPTFPPSLAAKATRSLEGLGVEVRTGAKVEGCDAGGIIAAGQCIEARTLIWAAGVQASAAARWLGIDADHAGRIHVGPDLSLPGDRDIFVIGDTATVPWRDGKNVPGIAPAAKQEGAYVAGLLLRRLSGKRAFPAFRYRHQGDLATIGRKSAVVSFGRLRLSGWFAWLLWGAVHIFFLIGFRNRALVALNWLWAYWTHEHGAGLITGGTHPHARHARGSTAPGGDS
jgi:NADH dehydrogenase